MRPTWIFGKDAAERRNRLSLLCLALVLLIAAWVRFPFIAGTAPYPRHPDERITANYIAFAARSHNLDPVNYLYPGLARYTAALTAYVGYLIERARGHLHALTDLELENYPFYRHPAVFWVTKYVWAVFSLVTLTNVGLLAKKLTGSAVALPLAASLLALSPRFLYSSREYVNVDMLSALIITGAILFLVTTWERRTWWHTAIAPGIFVGLAAGAKYPHGMLLLPFALAALRFWPDKRRVAATWAAIGIIAALAFWAANPYLPFQLHKFQHDLDVQRKAYANGWPGVEIAPGWPQLSAQVHHYWADIGWGVWALALAGIVWLVARQRFKGVVVVSHCLAFFAFFLAMRSDIPRTLLPLDAMMAAFAAVGAVALARAAGTPRVRVAAGLAIVALIVATVPWKAIAQDATRLPESRNRAVAWILANVPAGATLYIERTLDMDSRPLQGRYRIQWLDLSRARLDGREKQRLASLRGYFLIPRFGADRRLPGAVRLAARLRRALVLGTPIARFEGREDVELGYSHPVPRGDPYFGIYRQVSLR